MARFGSAHAGLAPAKPAGPPCPETTTSSVGPGTDQHTQPDYREICLPRRWPVSLIAPRQVSPFGRARLPDQRFEPVTNRWAPVPFISWNRVEYAPVTKMKSKENSILALDYDQLLRRRVINRLPESYCDFSVTIMWINQRLSRMI